VADPQQMRKTPDQKQYLKINWLVASSSLFAGDRDSHGDRRKFGRICERFWSARCCGSRRLQFNPSVPVMPCIMRD
jgi:hypothetical protein